MTSRSGGSVAGGPARGLVVGSGARVARGLVVRVGVGDTTGSRIIPSGSSRTNVDRGVGVAVGVTVGVAVAQPAGKSCGVGVDVGVAHVWGIPWRCP